MRAVISSLDKGIYRIDDAGESTCYLVCGEKEAALIDTLNGLEDLNEIIRTLTDLPVTVINTHGHCDHIGGNIFFEKAWIHPADEALALEHLGYMKETMEALGRQPATFRFVKEGQVFDLGGLTLEVVPLYGHTAGSVGLLCREKRLLFTGDGMNPHIWMQLEESLPLAVLHQSLTHVRHTLWDAFDYVMYGHAHGMEKRDKKLLDQLIAGCGEVMAGHTEKDSTYTYFGGMTCMQHPYGDADDQVLVYQPVAK
ncbi:MAG: MBL fold metallo-hydrolase [Clostridia bacterium]|nr:MBL fold metallo-hydrolase [Clostridia bacterium]